MIGPRLRLWSPTKTERMAQADYEYHAEELAATQPSAPPSTRRRPAGHWRGLAAVAIIGFMIGAAAVTYAVANSLTPSYSSSSQLSVNVAESTGLGEDSVVASNDLVAQYVQLLTASSVLAAPARTLGISTGKLRSEISAGSVSQQNLLQITAHSDNAGQTQRVAQTVTRDFVSYVKRTNGQASATYTKRLAAQLAGVSAQIAAVNKELGASTVNNANASLSTKLGSLLTEQQTLRNDIATRNVTSAVSIKTVVPAGSAGQVAPKPGLYAIVAALVALFIGLQLAILGDRRRRARAV